MTDSSLWGFFFFFLIIISRFSSYFSFAMKIMVRVRSKFADLFGKTFPIYRQNLILPRDLVNGHGLVFVFNYFIYKSQHLANALLSPLCLGLLMTGPGYILHILRFLVILIFTKNKQKRNVTLVIIIF